MKWGVRKAADKVSSNVKVRREKEKAYRSKMTNIAKNRNAPDTTQKLAKYRSKNLASRYAGALTTRAVSTVVKDAFTGQTANYGRMTKQQWAKKIGKNAINAAGDVAYKDVLAKNMSKRYNDQGRTVKKTRGLFTPEERIHNGLAAARTLATVGYFALSIKASQIRADRARGEKMVGRMLEDRTGNADIIIGKDGKVEWVRE